VATGLGIGLILWANLSLLGDIAGALGYPRWAASLVAAALAVMAVRLRADGVAAAKISALLYVGVLGFVVPVALVALTLAVSPGARGATLRHGRRSRSASAIPG